MKHFTIIYVRSIFLNMTIKTRNRITFGFFIFSILIVVAELVLLFFKPIQPHSISVITGVFLQNLYVIVVLMFILRAFEKTQSTEIFFFVLFLFACLCDSLRLIVVLFHTSNTYSTALLIAGNITLFARIMIPLSLMSTIVLNEETHRQNMERISLLILVVGIFLASFIPLNTSIIKPNYLVAFSYEKTIKITTIAIHCANALTLFMQNYNKESNQFTTIGYILLTLGNYMMFNSINYLYLIAGFLLLSGGTALFLRSLHKYYLWND